MRQAILRLFIFAAALATVSVAYAQQPCNMLSQAQIGSALGANMKSGAAGPKDCIWGATGSDARVYLTLRDPATWSSFKSTVQSTGHLQQVSGLGNDAFFLTGSQSSALYVLKGSHVVLIVAHKTGLTDAQVQNIEKTLAGAAISGF
jgi:hypothetical protein